MRRIALVCAAVCVGMTAAVAWGHSIAVRPSTRHTSRVHFTRLPHSSGSLRKTPHWWVKPTKPKKKATKSKATMTASLVNTQAVSATTSSALFGDQQVESAVDNNQAGLAEAFPFKNSTAGQATSIDVYLDSHSKASTVLAGIFADSNGHPGALLGSGTLSSPKAGAWNALSISGTAVTASKTYWLAVLGQGGTMYFRDRASGPCSSENSHQSALKSMPSTWSSGARWSTCPISAYVAGTTSSASAPPPSSGSSGTATDPLPPLPIPPVSLTAPQISGMAMQGQTLATDNGTWINSPTSYTYQWEDCDSSGANCANISGATASSYALTANDVNHSIRMVVTGTNAGGSAPASSAQTSVVQTMPAPSNTAVPAISGTTTQGQTLTASNGSWTGSPTSYGYQWQDCNTSGASCSNISGATSSNHTLTSNEVGDTLRVVVGATNPGGSTPATSSQTAVVQAPAVQPPTNTTLPAVSGTTTQGQTLSAGNGSWTGSPTSYGYQWQDCNTSGASCSNISGATSSSYALTSNDVGDTLRVVVTAASPGGSTPATSAQTAVVQAPAVQAPTNTALPAITGTTTQGQSLTASKGTWTGNPTGYSYQWRDCNASGSACSNVAGATSSSYTLTSNDVGDTLRVAVTATNAGGSTAATSSQTAVAQAPAQSAPTNTGAPTISGTATQGQTLTAAKGTWTSSPTSYAYQWRDCDTSGANCTSIFGATATTYTLTANDVGDTVRVIVTATNAGGVASATSASSAVVSAQSSGTGQQTQCVAQPSACGYPDATNSGMPAGTQLTAKSGNISANVAGQTISNVDLTNGTIVVTANNVTIKNSRITTGNGQLNGTSAVDIKPGVTGTLIEDTTMQGSNCTTGSLFAGVMNESGDQQTLLRDYGTCLDDILHGSGTIEDSYSIDNATIPNDHYEPIAYDGGDGSITIIHNTLLNPHDQTAAVFVTCYFGPVTSETIDYNLMAGGDYVIYGPEGNGTCNSQTGQQEVIGNRFSKVYFPAGGQYGIDAYFQGNKTTWSGNYWDENLAAASM